MIIQRSRRIVAFVAAGVLAAASAGGESIRTTTALAELGSQKPVRISGEYATESFYFPLPIRNFSPQSSALTFLVRTSTEVSPIGASLEVSVLDFPLKQEKLLPGQTQQIALKLDQLPPALLGSDYLKVTLKTVLNPQRAEDRCAEIAQGSLYVDVLPESNFVTEFDNQSPDWLDAGRLWFTLRNDCGIGSVDAADPVALDLYLKAASVISFWKPQIQSLRSSGQDQFFIQHSAGPAFQLNAQGARRQIVLQAGDSKEIQQLWTLISSLKRVPIPSPSIKVGAIEKSPELDPREIYLITDLQPDFSDLMIGLGQLSKTFTFATGTFTDRVADFRLDLGVNCAAVSRQSSAVLLVYVNDQLIHSEPIRKEISHLEASVPLAARYLAPQNRLRCVVQYFADAAECSNPLFKFEAQFDRYSTLRVTSLGDRARFSDLVRWSQTSLRNYQIRWAEKPGTVPVESLANLVMWFQKLQPQLLLSPTLDPAAPAPSIWIGPFSSYPAKLQANVPVNGPIKQIQIQDQQARSIFDVQAGSSAALIQLSKGEASGHTLLIDGFGSEFGQAFARLARFLNEQRWNGNADAIFQGNQEFPAFFTLQGLTVKTDQPSTPVSFWRWENLRWILLVPLWIVATITLIVALRKSKRPSA
jgi:Bacterial cellulose synthase subunit